MLQTILLYRDDSQPGSIHHQYLLESGEILPLWQRNHVDQRITAKSPEKHRCALACIGYGGKQGSVVCCRTLKRDDYADRLRRGTVCFAWRVGLRVRGNGRCTPRKRIHQQQQQCCRMKHTMCFQVRDCHFHFFRFLSIQTKAILVRNALCWEVT
jgi:hypothetical protein